MAFEYNGRIEIIKDYADVMGEMLTRSNTLKNDLVTLNENIKYGQLFTSIDNTIEVQDYTTSTPTSAGTMSVSDEMVYPDKLMIYQEFDYETLRPSRFANDMKAGALNTISDEFTQKVIGAYGDSIINTIDTQFWKGAKSATKTAVAAGSASTRAKAYVAGTPTIKNNGMIAYAINKGGYVEVTGTTVSYTNIGAEYDKIYNAIPDETLNSAQGAPEFFAPMSHKKMINLANSNATYRDKFMVDLTTDSYMFNGLKINFVNSDAGVIVHTKDNLHLCTDLLSDTSNIVIDKVSNNSDKYFIRVVYTLTPHITNISKMVLYI